MKFFVLIAFALLAQPSWACLSDSSILADGKWKYEGVWNQKANGTLEVQVATDPDTLERKAVFPSSYGPIAVPLTQCSLQPSAAFPGTYVFFGRAMVTDPYGYKTKIELTLHAVDGGLVLSPSEFSAVYTGSKFTPKDPYNWYSRTYFTAGHCINRFNKMQWCGTTPQKMR